MFATLLQVALGGAIGSAARYAVGVALVRLLGHGAFPLGVIAVNILGSFLMGAFVVLAATRGLTHLSPFLMIGVLGGFTTFSAFSLEAVTLWERGEMSAAVFYVVASVTGSIFGLLLGMWLSRGMFA
ncbi:fluoride efflux transporter CrcB [Rhodobacteraceae bacterium W635]|uniref:fluoride efflux transporter CrcB n=1 Tax=Paracoccaceae TaxID=31989 RepID=UPI000E3B7EBE|nr:fluoride efflux transporter CrcB [Rhodobacteraceae bacterium W635]